MSSKRLISRFVVVAAVIAAVAMAGAGSAFAEGVTRGPLPEFPNGNNGWYRTLPSIRFDWVTQNQAPGSIGSGYDERLVEVDCGSYANFQYLGGNFSGSAGPDEFSPFPEVKTLVMEVKAVSPVSPTIVASCAGSYERRVTVCFLGVCSGSVWEQLPEPVVSTPLTLKVDLWDPSIFAERAAPPDGLNGWYRSDVTVEFDCADQGSGLAAVACPPDEILSQEGPSVSSTARSVADIAGRRSDDSNTVTVKIDKTAPGVTCGASPTFVLGSSGNTVSATVTDETSQPLASTASADASTTTLGLHTANVTGSDKAGNTRTVSCPYIVGYGYSILSPEPNAVSSSNLGIKFQLTDANGQPIADSEAASLVGEDCKIQVSFVIGGAVSSCPTYNTSQDRFQLNVKTTKALQGENGFWVTVTVGSTVVLTTDVVPVTIK